MAGNTFGKSFRISTFGESHGKAIGVIIDGCPAGLRIDTQFIQRELDRRRPGQSRITTQRRESDTVQVLSGIYEEQSTGTPIALLIPNEDQRSKDYDHIRSAYRPSHADFTYDSKYGIRDHRGGGRSSARETAARVAAGAIAKLLLTEVAGIQIHAYVSRVANVKLERSHEQLDLSQTETNMVRCPHEETAQKMIELIDQVRKEGDTVGGSITCVVSPSPAGLGEPVFDKLHADLAKAMLSINAAHGFEYGSGFEGTFMRGSQHNDLFEKENDQIRTKTNRSGGIQGGISNGETIYFNVAFKPIATIMRPQASVDSNGQAAEVKGKGRHDPCVLPRAVPIVEAMTALVMADHWLRNRNARIA